DAVVNFVAFTPRDIERDIELFAGRTGQYVFISSASVYQKPLAHYKVTESTPLRNPYWRYSRDKIACEDRLTREYRDSGFPMTIVRPSLTYGPGAIPMAMQTWARPWTYADRILRGRQVIVPGDGTSLWTITHNSDFAKGFVGLLANAQAVGHAFHITSDEVITWDQATEALGRALGHEPRILHIASDMIASHMPDEEGSLLGDKVFSTVFDNAKVKSFVPGFVATKRFEQGIAESVAYLMGDPGLRGIDEGWNAAVDGLIERYSRAYP
ncbi:MAG: NAD-dependent epimerase/dehydratase family protein, partial [Oscillospiraceae bacterium]|nr:NAD-dependent epimerase/dehydratase family protein [Oscillospiraceae bacterium]